MILNFEQLDVESFPTTDPNASISPIGGFCCTGCVSGCGINPTAGGCASGGGGGTLEPAQEPIAY